MKSLQMLGLAMSSSLLLLSAGCYDYSSPPPPRVMSPPLGYESPRPERETPKPMPPMEYIVPAPVQNEPNLAATAGMSQQDKDFWEVYQQVGRPRIVIFVNRALDGRVVSKADSGTSPAISDWAAASASALDWNALERQLSDDFSMQNRITLVPPSLVREKLSSDELKSLESGQLSSLDGLLKKLDGDVLVQAQLKVLRRNAEGTDFVLVADAMNIRGGDPLGQATESLVAPQDKGQIQSAVYNLAAQLMGEMRKTWMTPKK